jgi:hypothetical protein
METGQISENDLMMRLVNAKKVMNKVDSGNFERGNINENIINSSPEEVQAMNIQPQSARGVGGTPSRDRINQSKLPDAIKKAMIENPIPQISLSETIDMDFVKGAKKLMEREGLVNPKKQNTGNGSNSQTNTSDLISTLTPIIENVVRKVMDEKLNQILSAQQTQSVNENLVLKVGDSIFKGKITGVNKAK